MTRGGGALGTASWYYGLEPEKHLITSVQTEIFGAQEAKSRIGGRVKGAPADITKDPQYRHGR